MSFPTRTVDLPSALEAFSWEAQTGARANSHGFRTREYTVRRPPDRFRVVVIGDSLTWGQGVRLEDTYPVRLEAELDDALDSTGLRAEVIALGVCGSRLIDNVIRLRAHAETLAPDLVVLQYFPNDVEYRTSYRRPELLAKLESGPSILQAVRDVLERDRYWEQLAAMVDPASLGWRLFAEGVASVAAWRDERGVPVLVAAFPPSDIRPDGGNFDRYAGLERFRAVLDPPLAELRRVGLPVENLEHVFAREAGRTYLCVSPDDGHPNALAHDIAARALMRRIDELGLLPDGRAGVQPAAVGWRAEADLRDRASSRWDELNADYRAQRELFDALVAELPEDAWTLAQAAHQAQQSGDGVSAGALYRRLPELAPEVAAPWYHLSMCTSDEAEREALLERMLELVPDHAPSVEELLNLRMSQRRVREACADAVALGGVARYPEQFQRAHDLFLKLGCGELGFEF